MSNTVKFGRIDNEAVAAITAAGTTTGGATALTGTINVLTTDTGEVAVRLPAGVCTPILCRTATAETATIFPPTGGDINGLGVDTAADLATTKVGLFLPHPNGLDYTFQLGA